MPRRSSADLAVIPIKPRDHRLQPPDDLEPNAAAIFRDVVMSCPASQFAAADVHLLVAFAQAVQISRRSAGDPALIQQWERATKLVAQLATKLRLSPSSRLDRKTAGRAIDRYVPSYYERMAGGGDE